jgi:hypothetical protein
VSLVALALAVAAMVVAARWYARRVDELGRRRDFPLVGVALLGVLAVAWPPPRCRPAREATRHGGGSIAGPPLLCYKSEP